MKKKLLSILTTALVSALFVTFIGGCSQDPETGSAKTGLISINLSANVPVSAPSARTALPPLTFTSYRLVFDPASGDDREEKVDSEGWNGTVQIPTGTYTKLTVYGYDVAKEAISTDNHTASGVSAGFEVSQGETTDVSVPMTFKAPQGGTGTVKYTVTNNSGYTLTAAKLTITPLAGGEAEDPEDITVGSEQTKENVPTGYYFATVTLQGAGLEASRSDVVHVYPNQTTTLSWTFAVGDFHSAIEAIWLVGDMKKDEENWDPQGVEMTKAEDGTFTWEGMINANERFRFHLTDVSTFEPGPEGDGKWYGDWFSSASDGAPGDGGYNPDITLDMATPMFFWSGKTDGNWKITATGYYKITVDPYARTLLVTAPPVVTDVTINDGNISLPQGGDKTFTAVVAGHNSPDQGVTWAISGDELNDGTAIVSDTGVFTIAEAESVGKVITVTATSVADTTEFDTVTVTVTAKDTPTVTSIAVTTAGEVLEVEKGATLDFNAIVTVTNAEKTVAWTVTNTDDSEVSDTTNTTITQKGSANGEFDVSATLTIADADRGKTLKVTATSTVDGFTNIAGSATVFARKYGDVYIIGNALGDFTSWPESDNFSLSSGKMTYAGAGIYTAQDVLMTRPTYADDNPSVSFKIVEDRTTGYGSNSGLWFNVGTQNNATTGAQQVYPSGDEGGYAFAPTHGGQYSMTLNTVANTVSFTSTQQVITITGGNTNGGLELGQDTTFTASTTVSSAPIVWKVYGDETNHTSNLATAGTSISTDGKLTVGSGDWTGHTLYITAESLGEAVTSVQDTTTSGNTASNLLSVAIIDSKMYAIGEMNRDGSGNWIAAGVEMTKSGVIFTWTGNMYDYSGRRNFRLSPDNTGNDGNDWKKTWIVPTSESDSWDLSGGGPWTDLPTARSVTTTTNKTWYVPSNGNYTITYDAVNKTVSVTRNGDAS